MMKVHFLFALLFFCLEVRANTDLDNQLTPAKRACSQFPRIERNESLHGRIRRAIGGDIAVEGEFPWMAALGYFYNLEISFRCWGIVISEYYVMTNAHCTSENNPPVIIRLGKVSPNDSYRYPIQASHYFVENIKRHPNYSVLTKKNDIALIRLTKRIEFSNTIRPACLHTDMGDIDNRTKLIVTGWGSTDPDRYSPQSIELRKIEINTMPLSECNATYLTLGALENIPALRDGLDFGQYCGNYPNIMDACQGDSGRPLQLIPNNDPNKATVVGIVSFGYACRLGLPGLYTRVAHYIPWIESIVWPEN